MKNSSLLLLSLFFYSASFAEQYTRDELEKVERKLPLLESRAKTCAYLLVHEFASDKLKQANCERAIDDYFQLLNYLYRIQDEICPKKYKD